MAIKSSFVATNSVFKANNFVAASILVIFFLLAFLNLGNASEEGFPFCAELKENGNLSIQQHEKLDSLLAYYREHHRENPKIDGYRIQLHFSYGREEALDTEEEFQEKYPDIETYLIYEQPYFKLRVGNYRTLIEAQPIYYELLEEYGNVFLVPTKIDLPELSQ